MSIHRLAAALVLISAVASAQTSDLEKGKQLFLGMCSRCHGADGRRRRRPQPESAGAHQRSPTIRRCGPSFETEFPNGACRAFDASPTPNSTRWSSSFVRSAAARSAAAHGNATNGKAVYQRQACSSCHIIAGEGGILGPELTNIGAHRAPDYLRQSIVEPAAALPRGVTPVPGRGFDEFLPVRVVTQSGQEVRGVRVNEDSFTIQMRDTAGRLYSFQKADLQQLDKEMGKSLMPDYKRPRLRRRIWTIWWLIFRAWEVRNENAIQICRVDVDRSGVYAQVPYQRIAAAESDPSTWMTYSGNYKAQRFSLLDQINRQNVARLKPTWVYQMRHAGIVETSPIVVDGVMYITEPPSTATALDRAHRPAAVDLDAEDSERRDHHRFAAGESRCGRARQHGLLRNRELPPGRAGREDRNRAVGHHGGRQQERLLHDAAPLAIDGKIIVGISGAETGIRGFLDAYDAKTGKRLWRTYTVPAPGEPGTETWGGDSWQHGGGSTWVTGSYDPDLHFSTGAPGIRRRTGTTTRGRATISTPVRCSRSIRPTARSSGISSSRRMTCTIGTRPRFRFCSTPRSRAASARW